MRPDDQTAAAALDELKVGARLKEIRTAAGLSQRALAERAGVSSVTVSLIEQGRHAPSVVTLHRILGVVSMGLSEFFELPESAAGIVVTAPTEMTEVIRGSLTSLMLADRHRGANLQMFRETYAPGATTGPDFIVHNGETAGLVVEGRILVESDEQSEVVSAGGGFHIVEAIPYRLTNVSDKQSVLICACAPGM